jgi:YggT family protein
MRTLIGILDALAGGIRAGSAAVLLIAAVIATLTWAVRTRRIDPFGGIARFVRKRVDPVLAPVERRLGRTGVAAANMPFMAVLVLLMIMAGAVFIVGGLRDVLVSAYVATSRGPSGLLSLAVRWTFGVLQLALLVRVITSWVGGTYSALGRLSVRLTDWFLVPLRRMLPPMGGLDISPILAWFLLGLVQSAFFTLL